ncbi:hypothetical protein Q5752_005408 [Cryptotrichosporon argae]
MTTQYVQDVKHAPGGALDTEYRRVDGATHTDGVDATGAAIRPTWYGRLWDTWDLPPAERRLLFKVDGLILTFASLGYFIKNLDQQNVTNAWLSGMDVDLDMLSNQLVTATSIWTVGYVIGQIPSNLLITRASPRWVIPSLELVWGIATLGSYAVKSYRSLYALRFLVGLAESGFYPGIHYLLGGWYTPREIGKRAMIFWLAGSVGSMFSGFLVAYTHLNDVHGLAGWRWLFIIDAIITIPIALFGYVFLPGLPLQNKKPWWLNEDEYALAGKRMSRIGRGGKTEWTWAKVRRLLGSWHTYFLPLLYVIWNNGYVQNPMSYYLKSFNATPAPVPGRSYTVAQINNLPLVTTAVLIVVGLLQAWLSDGVFRGRRWPFIYIGAVITIAIAIPLRVISLYGSIKAHFALYWLCTMGNAAGPLILTWINEICSSDTEKRALLVAGGNDLAYVVQAIAPNFVWKTTEFPAARKGFTWVLVLQSLLIVWTSAILLLLRRDERRALNSPSEDEALAGTRTPSDADEKDVAHVGGV